jgi:hypothetical protein
MIVISNVEIETMLIWIGINVQRLYCTANLNIIIIAMYNSVYSAQDV